jgi:hypothetical protein
MGWLIERKIRKLIDPVKADMEIVEKFPRVKYLMDNKKPGGVRGLEDLIRLAKVAKYERALIKDLENRLRQYKLDTPKSLW